MDSPRIKSVFGSYQVRPGFFKKNLHNIIKFVNLKYDVISFHILMYKELVKNNIFLRNHKLFYIVSISLKIDRLLLIDL